MKGQRAWRLHDFWFIYILDYKDQHDWCQSSDWKEKGGLFFLSP